MNDTLKYYADHADEFIENTLTADMSEHYRRFEKYLRPGDKILDLGFGSGRDSFYFLRQGYEVTSVDGSPEMCKAAESLLPNVRCLLFSDLDYVETFDAVWACASLLHVPKQEMEDVFRKVIRSMVTGGFFYVSYKYGTEERIKDGRVFADYTEESFTEFLKSFPELDLLETWVTDDVRPERTERWLNAIIKKRGTSDEA